MICDTSFMMIYFCTNVSRFLRTTSYLLRVLRKSLTHWKMKRYWSLCCTILGRAALMASTSCQGGGGAATSDSREGGGARAETRRATAMKVPVLPT